MPYDLEQFTVIKPQWKNPFISIWDSVRFVNCYMESSLKKEKWFVHVNLYMDIWFKISWSRFGITMIHNWTFYENEVKILNSLTKYTWKIGGFNSKSIKVIKMHQTVLEILCRRSGIQKVQEWPLPDSPLNTKYNCTIWIVHVKKDNPDF